MCTQEFQGVCAWLSPLANCAQRPCKSTQANLCQACSNADVDYVIQGQCEGQKNIVLLESEPEKVNFMDGLNNLLKGITNLVPRNDSLYKCQPSDRQAFCAEVEGHACGWKKGTFNGKVKWSGFETGSTCKACQNPEFTYATFGSCPLFSEPAFPVEDNLILLEQEEEKISFADGWSNLMNGITNLFPQTDSLYKCKPSDRQKVCPEVKGYEHACGWAKSDTGVGYYGVETFSTCKACQNPKYTYSTFGSCPLFSQPNFPKEDDSKNLRN